MLRPQEIVDILIDFRASEPQRLKPSYCGRWRHGSKPRPFKTKFRPETFLRVLEPVSSPTRRSSQKEEPEWELNSKLGSLSLGL